MKTSRSKNLKPFKKGKDERRNLAGRPKKIPALDSLLAEVLGEENNRGKTAAEIILRALAKKASKGNIRAGEILLERAYGKAKQEIKIEEVVKGFVIEPASRSTEANPGQ